MERIPAEPPPALLPQGPSLRPVTTALSQSGNPPGTQNRLFLSVRLVCLFSLPHGTNRHTKELQHFSVFTQRGHYSVQYFARSVRHFGNTIGEFSKNELHYLFACDVCVVGAGNYANKATEYFEFNLHIKTLNLEIR